MMTKLYVWALGSLMLLGGTSSALADGVKFGAHDVRSVFHVEKSQNANQVHYAVQLDAKCQPTGTTPVYAYWQRLKDGKRIAEPLVGAGVRVYGASPKQTVKSWGNGGRVEMHVAALPEVTVHIQIEKTAKGCTATPSVVIQNERVRLSHAFVQLRAWNLGIKYVDIVGLRFKDNSRVVRRVT